MLSKSTGCESTTFKKTPWQIFLKDFSKYFINSHTLLVTVSLSFLFLFHFGFNHSEDGEVILNQYETLEISLRVPHIHLTDLKNETLQKSRFFLKPVFHTTWWESTVTIVTHCFLKNSTSVHSNTQYIYLLVSSKNSGYDTDSS